MTETIQQQTVSEYLGKKVSHKQALKVIEDDFAGLLVFIGNLKEFRKAEKLKPQKLTARLSSRQGDFSKN